jgi:DNA-binding IclR family transcriptional regulator
MAKALSIHVGTRRPLLSSAGGIAVVLALPKDEARQVIAANKAVISRASGVSIAVIERMVRESERRGLGVNEQNVIPGWNAYGVPVVDSTGRVFASIMVAGEAARLSPAAVPDLMEVLTAAAQALSREAARAFGQLML